MATAIRIKKSRVEKVAPDVAKHATYRGRTVYIPPTEGNDNSGYFDVSENVDVNLMDSWLSSGGFDGRHFRAAYWCRDMWHRLTRPSYKLVDGEGERHAIAARAMCRMRRAIGRDWQTFENAMRWNEPMGYPGSRFATPNAQGVAATKAIVRSVLEAVAVELR